MKAPGVWRGTKASGACKTGGWDFPGGPVVKTLCFHCRGRGFDPWGGRSHMLCSLAKKGKKDWGLLFLPSGSTGVRATPVLSGLALRAQHCSRVTHFVFLTLPTNLVLTLLTM